MKRSGLIAFLRASCLLALAIHSVSVQPVEAALVTFSFTGAKGDELSFGPDAQPSGATVTGFSRGSGLTPETAANEFNSLNWTGSNTRDSNDYYTFSITTSDGFSMNLTRLELDERRSGTGILQWSIYSSLDGYASALATFTVPDNNSPRTDQGIDLGSAFTGIQGTVAFRIYGFQAESASGTWRVDNVDLMGTLTAVPEPAEWGLISACGLLTIAGFRSWRQSNRRAKETLI